MNASQLVPAGTLASVFGAKMLVYGDPGTGKSPAVTTAPKPVLLACEPGLLSMKGSTVPTWEGFTPAKAEEFFEWLFGSREAKDFTTVAVDSVTQYAENILFRELSRWKDPRKAYGEMAREVYATLGGLYFMKEKHVYLTAKKVVLDGGTCRPYFPGKDLNSKIPHLYDQVLHMEKMIHPGTGQNISVFRTLGTPLVLARDRSAKLAEFELPQLTALFTKILS